ncbi:MAG: WD40 repeat domain-containing protein [Myxococcota bacterium]
MLVATTWSGNVHVVPADVDVARDRPPATGRSAPSPLRHPVADGPLVCGEVHGDALVAGLYTGGVVCLGLADGAVRWRSADATGAVKSVHARGDRVAVVGRYDPLRVLDARTGSTLARLPLHTSVSDTVRFDARGEMLACAAADGEVWFVRLRDSSAGLDLEIVARSPGHERPIKALAWTPDGAVLAGDYAGRVVRHTPHGPSELLGTVSPVLGVSALLVRGDRVFVATFDGTVTPFLLRSAA